MAGVKEKPSVIFSTGEATTVEQVLEVIPVEEVLEVIPVEEVPVPEVPEAAETGEVQAGERRVAEEKEKKRKIQFFHRVDQSGCKSAVLHSIM